MRVNADGCEQGVERVVRTTFDWFGMSGIRFEVARSW
jgi:hypothetical protein